MDAWRDVSIVTSFLMRTGFESWTGRMVRRIRRLRDGGSITILTYHSVSAIRSRFTDPQGLRHRPEQFERHVDFLSRHFHVCALRDVVDALEQGRRIDRAAVLTLDDGYADSLRVAAPILRRRRLPMTVFPVTSVIGNRDLLWQHKLAWLLAEGHQSRVTDALAASGYPPVAPGESIVAWTRRCFRPEFPMLLEDLLQGIGSAGRTLAARYRPYLEPEEIASADPQFIEFGNHTQTHPILSRLNEAAQRQEIIGAADVLRGLTQVPPLALAYPFGLKRDYDVVSARIARQAGHRAVVDMRRRHCRAGASPFELSRRPAPITTQSAFEMAVEDWPGAYGDGAAGHPGSFNVSDVQERRRSAIDSDDASGDASVARPAVAASGAGGE